jgi:two-component sensor histidine kinase
MSSQDGHNAKATPLAVLTHAIASLASARAAADVVEIIRSTARAMMGCQGIAVVRREHDLCHYIEEDAIGALWKGQKFPASACVSGWAMAERRTIVIPNIDLEPRIPRELYADTFVRAIVMTPIRSADPIGAIGAYWSAPYQPTQAEVEMLEALASAAATAIENVRLIVALSGALEDAELARDELRHRVKNAYMGAESLARISLDKEAAIELGGRIQALSRAHALIDERLSNTSGIDLRELVEMEVAAYRTDAAERIVISGPPVEIESAQAVPLGLAINELATNALKHGSLSLERGRVSVSWSRKGQLVYLLWEEQAGPRIDPDKRPGEGTGLLSRLIERQLKGRLDHFLAPAGARCGIEFVVVEPTVMTGGISETI